MDKTGIKKRVAVVLCTIATAVGLVIGDRSNDIITAVKIIVNLILGE